MADISSLSGLAPVELELNDSYAIQTPRKTFQLPKRGVYQLQAPAEFSSEAFGVSGAGALTAQIDPTIVGPEAEGTVVKFQRVSAKVYQRNGQAVSQMGDYLVSCGVQGNFATPQDLADAVETTAGTVYSAELDWKGFKDGFEIVGMSKFPKLLDQNGNWTGDYQPWVNHPTATRVIETKDGQKQTVPVRVFANLYIRNFLPASA